MRITRKNLASIIRQTVMKERKNMLPYIQAGKTEEAALRYSVLQQEAMLARVVGTQKDAWARMHESTVSVLPGVPDWLKQFGTSVRSLDFPMGLSSRSVTQIPLFRQKFKKPTHNSVTNYDPNASPPGYYFSSQSWNGATALNNSAQKQDYINKVLTNQAWGNTKRGDVAEYAVAGLLLMAKSDAQFISRTDIASGRDIDSNIENIHFEVKSSEDSKPTDTLGSGSAHDSTEKYFIFATTEGTYLIRADLLNFYLNIVSMPEDLDDMIDFELDLAVILFTEKAFSDAIRWQTTNKNSPNPSITDIDNKINDIASDADLSLYLKRSLRNSARRSLGKLPKSRGYDQNQPAQIDPFVDGIISDLYDGDFLKNASAMSYVAKDYLIKHFSYLQRLLGHHKNNEAYSGPEYQTGLGKGSRGKAESSSENVPAIGNFASMTGTSQDDINYQISYLLAVADSSASSEAEFDQALNFVTANSDYLTQLHTDTIIVNALLNEKTVLDALVDDPKFKNILDTYYVHESGIANLVASAAYQNAASSAGFVGDDYISATPRQGTTRNNTRDKIIIDSLGLRAAFKSKLMVIFSTINFAQELDDPIYDPETYEQYNESKTYTSILKDILKHSK